MDEERALEMLNFVLNDEIFDDLSKHNPRWDSEHETRSALSHIHEQLLDIFALLKRGLISNDLHLLDILNEMRNVGLESAFICSLIENCRRYEGIKDLMQLWFEETDSSERDKIVADLQESLEDIVEAPQKLEEI